MTAARKHWLVILLLIAWLPVLAMLWPLPSESAAVDVSSAFRDLSKDNDKVRHLFTENEQKQMDSEVEVLTNPEKWLSILWTRWTTLLVVSAFGAFAIVYAAYRGRFWKVGLVASSSCYLGFVTGFPISRAMRAEQWYGWWMMVSEYPSWGINAFVYGVALPFMHVTLIVGALSFILLALKKGNLTLRSRPTR